MRDIIDIECPYCKERGYKPTLLGKVEKGTIGAVFLWCKNCKREVFVKCDNTGVTYLEPTSR